MKIGAVRECWVVRTPVTPPAVRGLIRRNEKPQQLGFPLSKRMSRSVVMEVQGGRGYESPWDEKPYETLPTGKKVYVDESDVVTFLDPPKELIPLDPTSYNSAAYLWKKIEDIPEERRPRLLQFIEPRLLISRAWEIAGARYENPKLAKMTASKLFSTGGDTEISLEYFNCRTSNGPLIISWIRSFKMAVFSSNNGQIYGRVCGGPIVSTLANAFSPLYFEVTEAMEVMATEEPCDIACRFGDGLLAIEDYPQGFPRPAKHPYPFNDSVVIYIRHIGPGVCVGQAWQEGKEVQQVPQRLCSDILMVKQRSKYRYVNTCKDLSDLNRQLEASGCLHGSLTDLIAAEVPAPPVRLRDRGIWQEVEPRPKQLEKIDGLWKGVVDVLVAIVVTLFI
ncbi:hypothetical protein YC2023_016855 [Brassica napus]